MDRASADVPDDLSLYNPLHYFLLRIRHHLLLAVIQGEMQSNRGEDKRSLCHLVSLENREEQSKMWQQMNR